MNVSHFMTAYVPACRDNTTISEVEKLLVSGESGPISVVDRDGRLLGILRSSDILEATHRFSRVPGHIQAHEAMCKESGACRETDDVDVALSRMRSIKLNRLPVVDASGKLVGAVSIVDPRLGEGRRFPEGPGDRPGAALEPTVVGHRSPSYVDGKVRPSK